MRLGYGITRNICIGDIILISSSTKFGKVIKKSTKGDFTHVAMVYDKDKAIEALTNGIKSTALAKFNFKDSKNIKILRVKSLQGHFWTDDVKNEIVKFVSKYRNLNYNYIGAVTSLSNIDINNPDKYFCSELICKIFNLLNITLFDKPCSKVTPNDYIKIIGNELIDVTDDLVVEIPEYLKLLDHESEFLDDRYNTTSTKEAKQITLFMNKVKDILRKENIEIEHQNSPFYLLLEMYRLDDKDKIKKLDLKFTELYNNLNINQEVYNKLVDILEKHKNFDIATFTTELANYNPNELIHIHVSGKRNIKDTEVLITKFMHDIDKLEEIIDKYPSSAFVDQMMQYFLWHIQMQYHGGIMIQKKVDMIEEFLKAYHKVFQDFKDDMKN